MKFKAFAILAGIWLVAGCGGGGGSSTPVSDSGYTGVTTQAVVTSSNAKALSADAYSGGQMSASSVGLAKIAAGGEAALLTPTAKALTDSVAQIFAASRPLAKSVAATAAIQETIAGYGGSMSYTINLDLLTGAFSGTITFNQFQETATSPIINGPIAFSGVYNQATSSFSSMSISISSLSATNGGKSFTLSGSESFSKSGTTETLTLSVVITNNLTGLTYWAKDYVLTVTGASLTLTGAYYDPVHGYVVISTITPLTVSTTDAKPTAGQLLFTGASGTRARLTFTSSGYVVEVDTTGSGTFVTVP